ncbi:MAG: hypothetical protein JXA43_01000 [Candidatus Diapherotrites archaeon]|nr:hypothetical protein [Candidatus Diapherotrites archaeon]
MRIAILGSSRGRVKDIAKVTNEDLDNFVNNLSDILSEKVSEVRVVPENSLYFDVAQAFRKKGGKVIGIVPEGDKIYGYDWLKPNLDKIDEKVVAQDWYWMSHHLFQNTDEVLCLSMSAGVFSDLGILKYLIGHKKLEIKKLIVYKPFLSEGKLPLEVEDVFKGILVYADTLEEIEKELSV